jgi:hypothetical protein
MGLFDNMVKGVAIWPGSKQFYARLPHETTLRSRVDFDTPALQLYFTSLGFLLCNLASSEGKATHRFVRLVPLEHIG